MSAKSELEQFLTTRSTEGQLESHGVFTVGAEEALRKVAEYQLPFAGAWAVKIIQSIVAAQSTSPIRVDLTSTEIRFYFMATSFTTEEFETAFYTLSPRPIVLCGTCSRACGQSHSKKAGAFNSPSPTKLKP